MMLTLIPMLCLLPSADASARADVAAKFYRSIHTPFSETLNSTDLDLKPELDDYLSKATQSLFFLWPHGNVLVDPETGRVVGAHIGDSLDSKRFNFLDSKGGFEVENVPRKISDAQAISLARKYYRAAGYDFEIFPFSVADKQGYSATGIKVDLVPSFRGVPYDRFTGGSMTIDRETGRLNDFYVHSRTLPTPPADLMPKIDRQRALETGLDGVLVYWGGALSLNAKMETHLCIWRPSSSEAKGRLRYFTDVEDEAAEKNQGRLVYAMNIEDVRTFDERTGDSWFTYNVYVDAKTGRTLQIDRWPDVAGGIGGGAPKNRKVSLPKIGAWKIAPSVRAGAWKGVRGKVADVPDVGFTPKAKAFLRSERAGFAIEIAADGRFAIRQADGTADVYRATGDLESVLLAMSKPEKLAGTRLENSIPNP